MSFPKQKPYTPEMFQKEREIIDQRERDKKPSRDNTPRQDKQFERTNPTSTNQPESSRASKNQNRGIQHKKQDTTTSTTQNNKSRQHEKREGANTARARRTTTIRTETM